jgi:hypothetical protein
LTVQVVTPEIYAPFLAAFGAGVADHAETRFGEVCRGRHLFVGLRRKLEARRHRRQRAVRLKEYKAAQYTMLERNPYFCEVDRKGQRLPYFDDIVFTVLPDMNAMSLRFLSGESDVDDFVYPYEYDHFKAESANGKFNLLEPGIGLESSYFWFNENTDVNPKTGQPYVDPKKLKVVPQHKIPAGCFLCH